MLHVYFEQEGRGGDSGVAPSPSPPDIALLISPERMTRTSSKRF